MAHFWTEFDQQHYRIVTLVNQLIDMARRWPLAGYRPGWYDPPRIRLIAAYRERRPIYIRFMAPMMRAYAIMG